MTGSIFSVILSLTKCRLILSQASKVESLSSMDSQGEIVVGPGGGSFGLRVKSMIERMSWYPFEGWRQKMGSPKEQTG